MIQNYRRHCHIPKTKHKQKVKQTNKQTTLNTTEQLQEFFDGNNLVQSVKSFWGEKKKGIKQAVLLYCIGYYKKND